MENDFNSQKEKARKMEEIITQMPFDVEFLSNTPAGSLLIAENTFDDYYKEREREVKEDIKLNQGYMFGALFDISVGAAIILAKSMEMDWQACAIGGILFAAGDLVMYVSAKHNYKNTELLRGSKSSPKGSLEYKHKRGMKIFDNVILDKMQKDVRRGLINELYASPQNFENFVMYYSTCAHPVITDELLLNQIAKLADAERSVDSFNREPVNYDECIERIVATLPVPWRYDDKSVALNPDQNKPELPSELNIRETHEAGYLLSDKKLIKTIKRDYETNAYQRDRMTPTFEGY